MSEQTFCILSGPLSDTQTAEIAPASYDRLVQRVTLIAQGQEPTAVGGSQIRIDVDSVPGTVYTLPQGVVKFAVLISKALPAESLLTAYVVANGGADTVSVTIESVANGTGTADTWRLPTAGDIQSTISAPEYQTFTNTLLSTGQPDPVPALMDEVVNLIRDNIRTGRRTPLGVAGTLPGGVFWVFVNIVRYQLFSRTSSVPEPMEKAEKAFDKAMDYLTEIREGKVEVIRPTVIGEQVNSGSWGSEEPFLPDTSQLFIGEDDAANPNTDNPVDLTNARPYTPPPPVP